MTEYHTQFENKSTPSKRPKSLKELADYSAPNTLLPIGTRVIGINFIHLFLDSEYKTQIF